MFVSSGRRAEASRDQILEKFMIRRVYIIDLSWTWDSRVEAW